MHGDFLYQHNFKNLVTKFACFKHSPKPSTIDLFLTNSNDYFQNTQKNSIGLSDLQKLVVTMLKVSFIKPNLFN